MLANLPVHPWSRMSHRSRISLRKTSLVVPDDMNTLQPRRPTGEPIVPRITPEPMIRPIHEITPRHHRTGPWPAHPSEHRRPAPTIPTRRCCRRFATLANIKGSACTRQEDIHAGNRGCNVKLSADRYSGRFIAAGNPLLVVNYESGCEAHATDNGGAAVFEQSDGKTIFRGFAPGSQANDCVIAEERAAGSAGCLTGHIGQGILEGGVAQIALTQDYSKDISISTRTSCSRPKIPPAPMAPMSSPARKARKYFELSEIKAGPRPQTVTVKAEICRRGDDQEGLWQEFPKPKEVVRYAHAGRRLCARRLREARHVRDRSRHAQGDGAIGGALAKPINRSPRRPGLEPGRRLRLILPDGQLGSDLRKSCQAPK